ncbi:alanine racemase [Cohaesibacter sp. ES.047]|uniref:alanine racemase n=1 Tax=Cohaesibacter sp. ES.047 TaxID=1798205 RepID=UPI000BB7DDBE|nr:alanine racemase [Cohaesibacter sp. ES.047]SNY93846.1 alanine racemase [Cohaesibacter sp. ES.047]
MTQDPISSRLAPHVKHLSAGDAAIAGSLLTIDLGALEINYADLVEKSGEAECSAVIKADAYGTGLEEAAKTLWQAGCRTFFVAHPQEGARARSTLPDATLYALNGLVGDDTDATMSYYHTHRVRPVLGCYEEIDLWSRYCRSIGEALPCGLHFDTGMNRLGLSKKAAHKLSDAWTTQPPPFTPTLIMSHLACADDPHHPLNSTLLDRFRAIRALFPDIPASLANSAGVFLGPDYHFDLTRPGIALYGGLATSNRPNPMQTVVTLNSRVLSTRHVPKGQSVSYGASEVTKRDSRLAIINMGYADGYLRTGSSSDKRKGARVYIEGYEAPIIGRVTMDLTIIDVTDIPEDAVKRGSWVELFGPHMPIDEVAAIAGTIGYELLTSLGLRSLRRYL